MTRLTDDQETLLKTVSETQSRVEARLAEVERDYEIARYDAEAPLRRAVLEADEAGVPRRQIHIRGLGTQDYGTLKRLLPAHAGSPREEPAEVVPKGRLSITTAKDNEYQVIDTLGRKWDFWTLDFDGHVVLERVAGEDTFALPVPADVVDLLKKTIKNVDLTGLETA